MKKYFVYLLILVFMFIPIMTACTAEPEVEEVVEEDVVEEEEVVGEEEEEVVEEVPAIPEEIIVAIGADPADLAPFVGMSMGRIAVLNTIYEYLIEQPSMGGDWVPSLAYEIEQNGDMTYQVTLFDYIYDSAGNHITAADAAWSYTTAKEGGNLRPLGDIESITAVDDYVVEFVFVKVLGIGELEKALTECPIVSQAAYEASEDQFATMPITTSPYLLTEYIPGSSLTFEKRADYWQTDEAMIAPFSQANVQKIVLQIIPEAAQHAIALETGSVDISKSVSGADITRFQEGGESAEGFQVLKFLDNLTIVLEFNGAEGPFAESKELRQAVAYALDSTAMCEAVAPGACRPAKTIGNPNFGGYVAEWDEQAYYEFDLTMAQDLMAEAGIEEGTLTLTLVGQNDERTSLLAQIIQAQLADLGINVELSLLDSTIAQEVGDDPTQWDMLLEMTAGGSYAFSPWQLVYDQNRNGGTTGNFFLDDELQALMDGCVTLENFTPENLSAFNDYQKEQLYIYGLLSYYNLAVTVDGIDSVVRDGRNEFIPGAFTYGPDF